MNVSRLNAQAMASLRSVLSFSALAVRLALCWFAGSGAVVHFNYALTSKGTYNIPKRVSPTPLGCSPSLSLFFFTSTVLGAHRPEGCCLFAFEVHWLQREPLLFKYPGSRFGRFSGPSPQALWVLASGRHPNKEATGDGWTAVAPMIEAEGNFHWVRLAPAE